jgi:alpha-galactosidase
MRYFSIGIAIAALSAVAGAQNLTGRWTAQYSSDDEARQIVLSLDVDSGGHFTGYVQAPQYEELIRDGRIGGNVFWFIGEREANNNTTQQRIYGGEAAGEKLTLFIPGNRTQRTEFTRVSAERPKALPPTPPKVSLPVPPPVKSNGLALAPPMGWNSWNKFQGKVTDKVVREIADAMVKNGMKDAGYVYVNIDDTWESTRDDAGNIRSNSKFPDMKALADYVHSKGLKLGIYSSPGPKTCAGYEGSYQHEAQDAKTWAAWGIDYLKYDWCSAARVYAPDQATMQAAYARMGEALLDSGRPMVYSLCQYGMLDVGEWGAKVGGNLWRTTGDIGDRWDSMQNIGFNLQTGREKYAGPGHWNDPDMLEIGNGGMSETEYRTHMSLWSILAAPLLAGNDLRDVAPGILEILNNKEAIAVDQDKLGKQGVRVSKQGDLEVWARPLADGGYAVGLFNRGASAARVTALWSDIGFQGAHAVRDLWAHADRGTASGAYAAEVPGHGVVLVKIAK